LFNIRDNLRLRKTIAAAIHSLHFAACPFGQAVFFYNRLAEDHGLAAGSYKVFHPQISAWINHLTGF
jgi:hypothetical protein